MPSAPITVATVGTPYSSASTCLLLTPEPTRIDVGRPGTGHPPRYEQHVPSACERRRCRRRLGCSRLKHDYRCGAGNRTDVLSLLLADAHVQVDRGRRAVFLRLHLRGGVLEA